MAQKRITARPEPGQRMLVRVEQGQDVVFDIDLSTADIQADGRQIAFSFPDDGQIVLDFTELGTAPLPNIVLADGTVLNVQEYLASLSGGDVEPAAGPDADGGGQGSGVGEYQDDPGQTILGVHKLDGLDPRQFPFERQNDLDGARGTDASGLAPSAAGGSASAYEGRVTTTGNFLANDTLNGASLASVTHNGVTYTPEAGQSVLVIDSARGGELTVDFLTGAFSYVSPESLNHSGGDSLPEEFVYTLDGPGGTSTGTLTLDILDTEPVARPDTNSVPRGGAPVSGNILGNDTLADGATLVHVGGREFGPDGTITIVTDIGGTLVISRNGDYTYTPPTGADPSAGLEDVFSYGLRDVDGDESSSTLTITLTDADPEANPDRNAAREGGDPVSGNILGNDVLADGAVLDTFGGRTFDQSGVLVIETPLGGVLRIQNNGDYTYTPPASADHSGSDPLREVFDYSLRDAGGRTHPSTLTIDVADAAPAANPDHNTVPEGGSAVSGNILGNDILADGAVLATFDGKTFDGSGVLVINTPLGGVLRIQSNGDYTYTPPANVDPAGGTFAREVFNYSLLDRDGDIAQSTLTIDVTDVVPQPPQPPAPEVLPDVENVTEGDPPVQGNLFTNDTLTGTVLTSVDGQPVPQNGTLVINTPMGGLLEIRANGDYTYTPPASADHSGSDPLPEVFNYILTDSGGGTHPSTLTINVADAAPVAEPDDNTVREGASPVSGNVLDNSDTVVDGATITEIKVDGVTHVFNSGQPIQTFNTPGGGKLEFNFSTGDYTYTPPDHLDHSNGEIKELFEYTLKDVDGDYDTATLTITVKDTSPVANDDLHRFSVTAPDIEVTGNVIDGVGAGGADDPSKDTPLRVGGWHVGEEGGTSEFNDLKIGEWQALKSGQFRWEDTNGNYTYKVVLKPDLWNTLYDSEDKSDISQLKIKADGVHDSSPVGDAKNGTFSGTVHSSASGLGVGETGISGSMDNAATIDFLFSKGPSLPGMPYVSVWDQGLVVDLGGLRSFIKLGLTQNTAPGYEKDDDQFVLDLYDQNGTLIGTDDNGGEFFEVKDFKDNAIRAFEIDGVAKAAAYVGIRAMPTDGQWADNSTPMPEGIGGHSSSFYLTHISVYDAPQNGGDKITYQITDSDGSTDAATLTLTPLYHGEIP
ncbi:MAG: Ig-like domain-containing protein [Pseudomonadota bacterium]|nr:Ig-like domain-containing protein [Pseudomonadota bacterium]